MLVVSLRGVNFGLWCQLGCSGQNAIIFNRKSLFQGCKQRNIKNYIFSVRFIRSRSAPGFIYSIHVIKVFFGVMSRKVGPRPDWSPLGA